MERSLAPRGEAMERCLDRLKERRVIWDAIITASDLLERASKLIDALGQQSLNPSQIITSLTALLSEQEAPQPLDVGSSLERSRQICSADEPPRIILNTGDATRQTPRTTSPTQDPTAAAKPHPRARPPEEPSGRLTQLALIQSR
jgi:hypothetical protein